MINKQNPHTFGKTAGATISNKQTRTVYSCGMTTANIGNRAGLQGRKLYTKRPESARNESNTNR